MCLIYHLSKTLMYSLKVNLSKCRKGKKVAFPSHLQFCNGSLSKEGGGGPGGGGDCYLPAAKGSYLLKAACTCQD